MQWISVKTFMPPRDSVHIIVRGINYNDEEVFYFKAKYDYTKDAWCIFGSSNFITNFKVTHWTFPDEVPNEEK